ncbi:MAG: SufD family Fe-S cluster assembly protein [Deltaproteobacteria bacterium]|nr:MAG: SufD family Fe-S cluster assembly protein [Deltaproteobacteria bacterium]
MFLEGLFILDQNQRSSHQTTIDHATPHTTSAEYYKGILSGSAQGDFEGKIIVRPQAQKTNSKQMNRNILLSKDAQVHTQPLLEIFANDVKCQHGATIGRLDEQALFYLRARGISAPQATQMLTRAFAEEIVARQPNEILRNLLSDLISKRLLELN